MHLQGISMCLPSQGIYSLGGRCEICACTAKCSRTHKETVDTEVRSLVTMYTLHTSSLFMGLACMVAIYLSMPTN